MNKIFLRINVFCYLVIAGFLGLSVITSLSSAYPWAITCYNCVLCRKTCPLGIDPYGFVTAAISNDPNLYVTATNIRVRLGEAVDLDPYMVLNIKGLNVTATQALDQGLGRDTEVTVSEMKVKDAAKYCPLCGNCEKPCPINLPVMKIIEDLKDDGKFNR
ncbi:MAG: hypothetical protein JRI22_22030 [Deltaproteobacteria bacterium]|nr:hypothetical protein [Deltaproteobacteria bacterium]